MSAAPSSPPSKDEVVVAKKPTSPLDQIQRSNGDDTKQPDSDTEECTYSMDEMRDDVVEIHAIEYHSSSKESVKRKQMKKARKTNQQGKRQFNAST